MTGTLPRLTKGRTCAVRAGFDGALVGGGLAVVVVGEDDGAGVDVGGRDVLGFKGRRYEDGGEALAEADDVV